ncbi:MAG: hypothetical protein WCB46_00985 [Methanoregula sp.]
MMRYHGVIFAPHFSLGVCRDPEPALHPGYPGIRDFEEKPPPHSVPHSRSKKYVPGADQSSCNSLFPTELKKDPEYRPQKRHAAGKKLMSWSSVFPTRERPVPLRVPAVPRATEPDTHAAVQCKAVPDAAPDTLRSFA